MITSRHHPIVSACRAIARSRGDQLLLDGWHLLGEALRHDLELTTVAYCEPVGPAERQALDTAARTARLVPVSSDVMRALSPVRSPTGVVALARPPLIDPDTLLRPAPALVVVLAAVQDPGNVGAAIRSAAAAGATGVVVDVASADPWGWKALRAAMGSTLAIPVWRESDVTARLDRWRAHGVSVTAAVPRDGTSFAHLDFTGPTVLLLGGEGPGLSEAMLARATTHATIPMRDGIESLNIAVAAALLAYEARRQRDDGPSAARRSR